ncbi:SseB family protein [Actinomadura fibrosa]|uniref:SseB family protein n=1 Tax=Actinomadura fibrosa TaxID=111802 RepID=A0ABW2XHZ0_9ACTN|nr:SseB family protein [Actinomadura fibrosa]
MDWNDFAQRLTLELSRLPVRSFLIVQGPSGLPYVQAMRSEGALDAEAVSSAFLPRPLAPRQERRLRALGWEPPDEEERQNWWDRFTLRERGSRASSEHLEACALLSGQMVGAFRDVYGIESPLELVYQASRSGPEGGPLALPGLGIPLAIPENEKKPAADRPRAAARAARPSGSTLERALAEARERGDQQAYLELLARAVLYLPAPGDPNAADHQYATAQFGDGTFVLAFTSPEAMDLSLQGQAVHHRQATLAELSRHWPHPEWQLAINPGLPSASYLDANALLEPVEERPPARPSRPARAPRPPAPAKEARTRRPQAQQPQGPPPAQPPPPQAPPPAQPQPQPQPHVSRAPQNHAPQAPANPVQPEPVRPQPQGDPFRTRPVQPSPTQGEPVEARPPRSAPAPAASAHTVPPTQPDPVQPRPPAPPAPPQATRPVPVARPIPPDPADVHVAGRSTMAPGAPPAGPGSHATPPDTPIQPRGASAPAPPPQEVPSRAQGGRDEPQRMGDRTPAEGPAQVVVMQKVIRAEHVQHYLEGGYDLIAGYVHRLQDVRELNTPAALISGLGLVYEGSPFALSDKEIFVVRWPAVKPSLFRRPLGGIDEWSMGIIPGGWVIEKAPFPGSGYAPGDGPAIPEFKIESQRLPHGAELYRLDAAGAESLVAGYDADLRRWLVRLPGGRG